MATRIQITPIDHRIDLTLEVSIYTKKATLKGNIGAHQVGATDLTEVELRKLRVFLQDAELKLFRARKKK